MEVGLYCCMWDFSKGLCENLQVIFLAELPQATIFLIEPHWLPPLALGLAGGQVSEDFG